MFRCDLFKWDLEPESKVLLKQFLAHKLFHHRMRPVLSGLAKNMSCPNQRKINLNHSIYKSFCILNFFLLDYLMQNILFSRCTHIFS